MSFTKSRVSLRAWIRDLRWITTRSYGDTDITDPAAPGCCHPGVLARREMAVLASRTTGSRRRNGRRPDAWAILLRMAYASIVRSTLRLAHAAVSECAQSNRTRSVHVTRRAAARFSELGCPTT